MIHSITSFEEFEIAAKSHSGGLTAFDAGYWVVTIACRYDKDHTDNVDNSFVIRYRIGDNYNNSVDAKELFWTFEWSKEFNKKNENHIINKELSFYFDIIQDLIHKTDFIVESFVFQ